MTRVCYIAGIVLVLTWALAGCGGEEPAPQPTATSVTINTVTPAPTGTPATTPTSEPTETPVPTATPDYINAAPTRPPSPGHTIHGRSYPDGAYEFIHSQFDVPAPPPRVPDDYLQALPAVDTGVCPLTGMPVSDPGVLERRPLNVRIDNTPPARPQAGLAAADVVWEALAEGGFTRFTATYLCQDADPIGPVRSARLIDLQLWPMLDAILVHVGASQPVMDMILASPWAEANLDELLGTPGFYRIDQAPRGWLRTYTSTSRLWNAAEEIGINRPAETLRGWKFSEEAPATAAGDATEISIPYAAGTSSVVNYRYDDAAGEYLRFQGQAPHTARPTGDQLTAATIFVIFSEMTVTPIVEDSLGNKSLHFQIYGEGEGLVFRDGSAYEVTWRREGENVFIRPITDDGDVLPFKPGQLWVQIVPDSMDVEWQ